MDIVVGDDSALKPESMLSGEERGVRFVVIRTRDGVLSALEDRCSHANVRLSGGELIGGELECPAHGARFDVSTGKALCLPAVGPVRTFPVRTEAGKIILTLP